MFSRDDIKKAISEGHLKIFPLSMSNLTGVGYNLSTTNFAFSVNKGILLTVHQRTTSNGIEQYVFIPANDTVLFFTKENLVLDKTIGGTVHSKVARVCQGLGHICTTIDPTWRGQLIISVSNPTSESIMFELDKKSGNIMTMLLFRFDTMVTGTNIHDNNKSRCDLLLEHFTIPSKDKKNREKHLELKEFVVNEFADSLNGDDSFLHDDDKCNDKYSMKAKQLSQLKTRLENDKVLIEESRYTLGAGGEYKILRSDAETTLLKNCAIYELKEEVKRELPSGFLDISVHKIEIIECIKCLIDVITYELEMINHMRRIEWQNYKILHFAGEGSEIVRERRYQSRQKFRKKFWLPLLAMFAVTIALVIIVQQIVVNQTGGAIISIITVAATIYAPILVFVLDLWHKSWKAQKEQMKEE